MSVEYDIKICDLITKLHTRVTRFWLRCRNKPGFGFFLPFKLRECIKRDTSVILDVLHPL